MQLLANKIIVLLEEATQQNILTLCLLGLKQSMIVIFLFDCLFVQSVSVFVYCGLGWTVYSLKLSHLFDC